MKKRAFYSLLLGILLTALPAQADDIHCTGIWVGGVELTSQNDYATRTGSMGILNTGYAKYDPETKTLYLHQLLLNTDGVYNAIELLNDDDITITCYGDCRFVTRRAIYKPRGYKGNITLRYADGWENLTTKFTCTCTCSCIETPNDVYIYKIPVELMANCRFNESPYNIAAIIARNITIDSSPVICRANIQKAVQLVDGGRMQLVSNHISSPSDATTDAEGYVTFPTTSLDVTTQLPDGRLDFYIAETQVTLDNQHDIRSRLLKSGKIVFERTSNTLVLDNVVLDDDAETLDPFENMIEVSNRTNFKIRLIGNNVIRADNHSGIVFYQKSNDGNNNSNIVSNAPRKTRNTNVTNRITIYGDGTLTMEDKTGITTWQDLYINNTTVIVQDSIRGVGKKAPAIEINASHVKTAGISGFDSFKLTDCSIVAPAKAAYDEGERAMNTKGSVEISTGTTGVKSATTAADASKASPRYTTDGRRLSNNATPKGIYIENGKKKLK